MTKYEDGEHPVRRARLRQAMNDNPYYFGFALVILGVIFLLSNYGLFIDFRMLWPILLMIIGVVLIVAAKNKK